MKRNLYVTGIVILSMLFLTSFSIRENPQDPPRGKKAKKHIVLEKIDNGKKTTLDTIIAGDDILVWNGDTIGGKGSLKWITKDEFDLDSIRENLGMNFKYEIKDNGDDNVIVLKSGNGGKHIIREFITDGDSGKAFAFHVHPKDFKVDHDVMIWNDKDGDKAFFGPDLPDLPHPPNVLGAIFSVKKDRANIIDLSDPGIISYKKKKNKDGTEKITIVRKQVKENDAENVEKIIMAPKPGKADVFFGTSPDKVKKIRIIKDGDKDKEIEIEENSENN